MVGMASPVEWVDVDGVRVAFQVVGEGPRDLLALDEWSTNLDLDWTDPFRAAYLRRLAENARLIRFDKGGMGLSDRVVPDPSNAMATWAAQARAVLDVVASEQVGLLVRGWSGPLGLTLAADLGDRVDRLSLVTTFARMRGGIDHPDGVDPTFMAAGREIILARWGSGIIPLVLGQDPDDLSPQQLLLDGRYERCSVAPRDLAGVFDAVFEADATASLPSITAQTLVVHRTNPILSEAQSRSIASIIPDATFRVVEDTTWSYPTADDEIGPDVECGIEHLVGSRGDRRRAPQLLTMVFADVVGSTPLVSRVGDGEWAEILRAFTATVEVELGHHRGRLVNRSGDGFFAVLDTPSRALRFARALCEAAGPNAPVRVGVHTGECEVDGDDVLGLAVHATARIMGLAGPNEVLVSEAARIIVDPREFTFTDLGPHDLRGVPGRWQIHRLEPR